MRPACWLLAVLAVGCAHGASATAPDDVTRMMAGPVARDVAAQAPEAWVEVARLADAARSLRGNERVAAEAELALALEWAQSVARRAAADHARAADDASNAALAQEGDGFAAETARLLDASRRLAASRVQNAAVRAPIAAPRDAAHRAALQADLARQTELMLAAAEFLGADGADLQRARAASAGPGGDGVATAAAALRRAEALLEAARRRAPVEGETDAVRLQASLSANEGVEAYRDARGVIAVLHGLFAGARLAPTSAGRVAVLARVLRAHPSTPVRIESFASAPTRAAATSLAQAQATALRGAVEHAGADVAHVQAAGYARTPSAGETDRVEVVLLGGRTE